MEYFSKVNNFIKKKYIGFALIILGIGLLLLGYLVFPLDILTTLPQTGEEEIIKKSPYTNIGPVLSLELKVVNSPLQVDILSFIIKEDYATMPNPSINEVNYEYKISMSDNADNILWEGFYRFPRPLYNAPPDDVAPGVPSQEAQKFESVNSLDISLNIPYDFNNGSNNLKIISKEGMTLAERDIPKNPFTASVTYNMQSVNSDEARNAPDTNSLNILVFGDNFSDEQSFLVKFNAIKDYVLQIEPFKMRSSQIIFTPLYNSQASFCLNQDCNLNEIKKIISSRGIFYNKLIAVVDKKPYYGVSWEINGDFAEMSATKSDFVSAHELGHLLGLDDEYIYKDSDPGKYLMGPNCFGQSPPNSNWSNIVPLGQYFKGCLITDRYRSSMTGIMYAPPNNPVLYHNTVSLEILNSSLDRIAGSFKSSSFPPDSNILEPENNSLQNGTVKIKASFENISDMQRAELWIDGVIQDVRYTSPFEFNYNAGSPAKNNIKIEVRAYDGLNRVGKYNTATINSAGPSPAGTLVPTGNPVRTNTPVLTDTTAPSETPAPTNIPIPTTPATPATPAMPSKYAICGSMDIDGNGILNDIDLNAFMEVYGRTCTDSPPPAEGCGGKDVRKNGLYDNFINYIDLDSFISRSFLKTQNCYTE
jgi:hypothetical protein